MKKSELVKAIAAKGAVSQQAAEDFVNLMFDSMIGALMREERIAIRGFGSFTVRRICACTSHNPKTGEGITVPDLTSPAGALKCSPTSDHFFLEV